MKRRGMIYLMTTISEFKRIRKTLASNEIRSCLKQNVILVFRKLIGAVRMN